MSDDEKTKQDATMTDVSVDEQVPGPSDETVLALTPEMVEVVLDIIEHPPQTNKYETLKKALITRHSPSEQKQLEALLGRSNIGDLKPSGVLRQIRNLAKNTFDAKMIKSLWLRKLPEYVRIALIPQENTNSSDELALIGDKLHECIAKTHNISEVNRKSRPRSRVQFENINERTPRTSTELPNNHSIEARLKRIELALSNLGVRQRYDRMEHRFSPRQRERTYSRNRSSSRQRPYIQDRSQSRDTVRSDTLQLPKYDNPEFCWYHQMFGDKAGRCRAPCNFKHAFKSATAVEGIQTKPLN